MSLTIDDSAVKRIQELRTQQDKPALLLRVAVDGGGCSGFQYRMELTEDKQEDETLFKDCVVADDISLEFLDGSTLSFEKGLIGSEFKIDNPNATSGCGCGTSFSIQ